MEHAVLKNLKEYDGEFEKIFSDFLEESKSCSDLDEKTRCLAVLCALEGCGAEEVFSDLLIEALESGVSGKEIKELLYQSAAYLGIGRVRPFIERTNAILPAREAVPARCRAADKNSRRLKGEAAQVAIFGEGMMGFAESGDEEVRHINRWLTENCFGDYYTRPGADLATREMATFCLLAAQGGCEPQLISHAAGNMHIGNDRKFLIAIVSAILPYIGYPRALNALKCIETAYNREESK